MLNNELLFSYLVSHNYFDIFYFNKKNKLAELIMYMVFVSIYSITFFFRPVYSIWLILFQTYIHFANDMKQLNLNKQIRSHRKTWNYPVFAIF